MITYQLSGRGGFSKDMRKMSKYSPSNFFFVIIIQIFLLFRDFPGNSQHPFKNPVACRSLVNIAWAVANALDCNARLLKITMKYEGNFKEKFRAWKILLKVTWIPSEVLLYFGHHDSNVGYIGFNQHVFFVWAIKTNFIIPRKIRFFFFRWTSSVCIAISSYSLILLTAQSFDITSSRLHIILRISRTIFQLQEAFVRIWGVSRNVSLLIFQSAIFGLQKINRKDRNMYRQNERMNSRQNFLLYLFTSSVKLSLSE